MCVCVCVCVCGIYMPHLLYLFICQLAKLCFKWFVLSIEKILVSERDDAGSNGHAAPLFLCFSQTTKTLYSLEILSLAFETTWMELQVKEVK